MTSSLNWRSSLISYWSNTTTPIAEVALGRTPTFKVRFCSARIRWSNFRMRSWRAWTRIKGNRLMRYCKLNTRSNKSFKASNWAFSLNSTNRTTWLISSCRRSGNVKRIRGSPAAATQRVDRTKTTAHRSVLSKIRAATRRKQTIGTASVRNWSSRTTCLARCKLVKYKRCRRRNRRSSTGTHTTGIKVWAFARSRPMS